MTRVPPQRAPKQSPMNDVWRLMWVCSFKDGLLETVKKHMSFGGTLLPKFMPTSFFSRVSGFEVFLEIKGNSRKCWSRFPGVYHVFEVFQASVAHFFFGLVRMRIPLIKWKLDVYQVILCFCYEHVSQFAAISSLHFDFGIAIANFGQSWHNQHRILHYLGRNLPWSSCSCTKNDTLSLPKNLLRAFSRKSLWEVLNMANLSLFYRTFWSFLEEPEKSQITFWG